MPCAFARRSGAEAAVSPWGGRPVPEAWRLEAMNVHDSTAATQLLPLLSGSGLLVSVWLLILDKSGYARLSDDRFLGHDPMGATSDPSAATQEAAAHAQTILLFSGDIP